MPEYVTLEEAEKIAGAAVRSHLDAILRKIKLAEEQASCPAVKQTLSDLWDAILEALRDETLP